MKKQQIEYIRKILSSIKNDACKVNNEDNSVKDILHQVDEFEKILATMDDK